VGSNVVALSLSGGGMRAAAFSFGVLQALADADASGTDIFDELTFMSSVSGGSLTAAYRALHGRKWLSEFRRHVLARDVFKGATFADLYRANKLASIGAVMICTSSSAP
jgi:NTE family protein